MTLIPLLCGTPCILYVYLIQAKYVLNCNIDPLLIDGMKENLLLHNYHRTRTQYCPYKGRERGTKASEIAAECALKGIVVQSIHGNRAQEDREQALVELKSGEVKILIATDVASRGIDIGDVTHVFNFDFPKDMEEYVHRVGRTGRAGKTGTSISFWDRADWKHAQDLIGIMEVRS